MRIETNGMSGLSQADGAEILGAVYFALCGERCTTVADMQANHAAQGTVLKLREELCFKQLYGMRL